jgi:hypothetical protein
MATMTNCDGRRLRNWLERANAPLVGLTGGTHTFVYIAVMSARASGQQFFETCLESTKEGAPNHTTSSPGGAGGPRRAPPHCLPTHCTTPPHVSTQHFACSCVKPHHLTCRLSTSHAHASNHTTSRVDSALRMLMRHTTPPHVSTQHFACSCAKPHHSYLTARCPTWLHSQSKISMDKMIYR